MKQIYTLLIGCLLTCSQFTLSAQNGFQYQAVLRNAIGAPMNGQNVSMKFSILKDTEDGASIYSETHTTQTNNQGVVSLKIGEGTATQNSFDKIDWAASAMFVKTEIDKGQGYNLIGVQQLQTVPYAMYAKISGGIEKKSNDGTLWKVAIDNDGNLSTYKVEETIIPIPEGYSKLVFNDEFNGEGLPSMEKWRFEEGYVRNGEKQYYTNARLENCFQKDGFLHLVALNDSVKIDGVVHPVTSASLHTRDKSSWLYCKVEMRAKLPMCLGTWPAIWMMPQDDFYGAWPRSGEIDIMENVGYDPDYVHFAVHTQKYNSTDNSHKNRMIYDPTTYSEFHTYGIEWYEDRIDWYFDGVRRFRVTNSEQHWTSWPFNKAFYLIVNHAFGGGWGGREGIDLKGLPQEYIIDYVRVYQ